MPITPSNIGAYEVARDGVDEGAGRRRRAPPAAFAIAAHIFNILWITVAGFVAMWALGLSLDDVFSAVVDTLASW